MAYFRVKNIKNKKGKIYPYAYLVENKWKGNKKKGKGARQKVKAYLGRVYAYNIADDADFFSFHQIDDINEYIKNREMRGIIRDLIEWEFSRHNVDSVFFNRDNLKINYKTKDVAIKMNEGYLCNYTLSKLINFKIRDGEEVGFELAKTFVDAGLDVPKELFIKLFEKITNDMNY
ncbi:MAG: hypothetical protein KJ601_05140 [Nanoarchaeota archaeon]|nr:hypothetical protein [Nanoarchaeota archaeon]MBU1704909.1 hypothetical protein [Nanoarchaeota archaeon]